ncbi:MAG: NADH-quinone oxidoreductase subunit C [Deltaproteobacteria bacterium]|nr:NADH-quinone oxidoreductase subunit C [Deltaproteobacteria bacterium]
MEPILIDKVAGTFKHSILSTTVFRGEVTHLVEKDAFRSVCNFLKTDPDLRFNCLVDVIGVDYINESPRFEVVYQLYSITKRHRLRIKIKAGDLETVPTITDIWSCADWPEREVYDMFGIVFEGHPNLKRIYLADDWEGWPLRKDYPLRGYKDRYNPFGEEK